MTCLSNLALKNSGEHFHDVQNIVNIKQLFVKCCSDLFKKCCSRCEHRHQQKCFGVWGKCLTKKKLFTQNPENKGSQMAM